MVIYKAKKNTFCDDVVQDKISGKIYQSFLQKIGHTTESQIRAWSNSMQYMYKVLMDENIPIDAGIAIEYKIPCTSKRIDFIISGKSINKKNAAIIIELKQWEKANIVSGKDAIVSTYVGGALREVVHPSYQAWSYVTNILDYNEEVQEKKMELYPCAYLHNYVEPNPPSLSSHVYDYYVQKAPLFIKGDVLKLRSFINKYIKYGDNNETLYILEHGKIRPSKSLQDSLSSMLKGNREFIMIDEQKSVYETALKMAKESFNDMQKRVIIVKGGPGTGKSVIAINLLVALTKKGMVCQYVTKNSAPRNVYEAKLSGSFLKTRIHNLFKNSGSYVDAKNNEIDALIVDEAHRLNKKSGIFRNKGENQIKEIIKSSKFSVFFIDESQRVDINDIGTISEIEKYIKMYKAEYEILTLSSQFRCSGSDEYVAWLDNILEINKSFDKVSDINYDIEIYDNPNEMKEKVFKLNKINNKSRMLAGYCWDWIKKGKDNPGIYDIVIPEYNFKMSWNLGNTSTWAIDPASVNQIGCIHTSQGLEFDYVGVIIGSDLRYENDKIITDFTKRSSTDKSIKGLKTIYKKDKNKALKIADIIIKNTYKTLLTRGQKGCYIYCVDKKLGEYLKNEINKLKKNYYLQNDDEDVKMCVAEEGEKYDLKN